MSEGNDKKSARLSQRRRFIQLPPGSEYYYPHDGDRQRRRAWKAGGSLDERQRARHKARRILQEHSLIPIPAEIDAAIRRKFDILLPESLANEKKD